MKKNYYQVFITSYFPDIVNLGIYINGVCTDLIVFSIVIPNNIMNLLIN